MAGQQVTHGRPAPRVTISEELMRAYAAVAEAAITLRTLSEETMFFDQMAQHDGTDNDTFDEAVQTDELATALGKLTVTTRLLQQKLKKKAV
jgi:hypothetical protein